MNILMDCYTYKENNEKENQSKFTGLTDIIIYLQNKDRNETAGTVYKNNKPFLNYTSNKEEIRFIKV